MVRGASGPVAGEVDDGAKCPPATPPVAALRAGVDGEAEPRLCRSAARVSAGGNERCESSLRPVLPPFPSSLPSRNETASASASVRRVLLRTAMLSVKGTAVRRGLSGKTAAAAAAPTAAVALDDAEPRSLEALRPEVAVSA